MKITIEMVDELNQLLKRAGCIFRYELSEGVAGNTQIQIAPLSMKYLDSYILNINTEFRKIIVDFFAGKGIKVEFNNSGNILWSFDGYNTK